MFVKEMNIPVDINITNCLHPTYAWLEMFTSCLPCFSSIILSSHQLADHDVTNYKADLSPRPSVCNSCQLNKYEPELELCI